MTKPLPKAIMPIITVESVDTIRNFYVETLGFDHVMGVVGKDGKFDFVTVVKDGARIMFARAQGPTSDKKGAPLKQPVEIYIEVASVEDPYGYEIWFYQTTSEPKPPQGMKLV